MRKTFSIVWSVLSTLLCIAAVLCGGGAFAMADVNIVDVPEPTAPDSKGLETQLEKGATASHVTESGFNEDEIDRAVANFRPFRFPLEYDVATNARQAKAGQQEIIHYRSGVNPLEDTLLTEITTDANMEFTITKNDLESGNISILPEYATVLVPDVDGENGQPVCLFVKASNVVTGEALCYVYNCTQAVTIPENTKLIQASYACSESQMVVDPDNYQPVPVTVFLQKKNANIVFTDRWLEIAKKADFYLEDLKGNALFNFKRKMARTRWLGSPGKFKITIGGKMGDEYVYFEEGVIRQINMLYSIPDTGVTRFDLNAIAKMQFTSYAVNTEAQVYCGKNFIEKLLRIPATENRDFWFETKTQAGMVISSWKNNFGTLNFVYDPTLDDIGYEDYAVVLDIKNATHYVLRAQKEDTQDMKKGTGEVREAQRHIISQIDCIALRGYNAILIGPASNLAKNQAATSVTTFAQSVASLDDADQVSGVIYVLTADDDTNGFKAGSLVTWDNMWVPYVGVIEA